MAAKSLSVGFMVLARGGSGSMGLESSEFQNRGSRPEVAIEMMQSDEYFDQIQAMYCGERARR